MSSFSRWELRRHPDTRFARFGWPPTGHRHGYATEERKFLLAACGHFSMSRHELTDAANCTQIGDSELRLRNPSVAAPTSPIGANLSFLPYRIALEKKIKPDRAPQHAASSGDTFAAFGATPLSLPANMLSRGLLT